MFKWSGYFLVMQMWFKKGGVFRESFGYCTTTLDFLICKIFGFFIINFRFADIIRNNKYTTERVNSAGANYLMCPSIFLFFFFLFISGREFCSNNCHLISDWPGEMDKISLSQKKYLFPIWNLIRIVDTLFCSSCWHRHDRIGEKKIFWPQNFCCYDALMKWFLS